MNAMHSRILLRIFQLILVFLHISPFNALRLSFYNNIADTPQETIEFESGSLFYTGELPHIKSFTCTTDIPTDTVTVTWYDTSGNEVPMGTGASTSLYWTGSDSNKTLHTSNDAGTNFISVANQGNNFTCRVNGANAQMKYFGIYWVRPILIGPNTIQTDLRGFRIYTKDTPPVISEFTLQRGLFNFDFSKRYKVQSLKGSSSIVFRPDVVTSSPSSIPSIIDNVTFSNTSVCQSIGTSDSDQLYTTISDRAFFNYEPGSITNPRLSNSACIENGTISPLTLTIGDVSPDIRYTCPLVFNGVFIDTGNLNLDTGNSNVTAVSAPLNLTENRRRLWIDFSPSFPVSLVYDRDYVCEDLYSTRISFRVNVDGNNPLEVFDSISAATGVVDSINYISTAIPNTLYCVSMSSTVEVTWKFDNIANRSQFVSPVQVPSNSSYLPYATTPRIGRSDLFLNATVTSETEGYYTCSDGTNEVRVGVFLQTPVAPVVTASSIEVIENDPINITCAVSNSPYPPALYYWTGPNFYSTSVLDTTGFTLGNSGFYTCHGTNVVGADDVTINLAITPPNASLVSSNLTVMDFYFEEDSFQLSCIFRYVSGYLISLDIFWTRDNLPIISGTNGIQIQEMSTSASNTMHSVLYVASAVPANTGMYKCEAFVGSSEPIASNPANVVVEASYQPDSIALQLVIGSESVQLNWNGTYRNRITPETYVVSLCELPQCNSCTQSPSLTNTSYTITGLKVNFSYSVFVIATNRYGSTNGTREDFSTNPLPPPRTIELPQPDLGDIFVADSFQISCKFETTFISSISIEWYHNNTLNTIFPNTTNTNGNTATSTLTVTASSLSQAGDYHCVATVGASSPTNSTPVSVIINSITLPNAIPVTITNSELRNATISWTPSIQFPSLTETYTLVYQRVGDSSYQTINTLNSTSFTLTELLFDSQYRVYVNATNRFGTTQGPDTTFSTDQVRLYFMKNGEIVQFASGSIFRGGIHSIIIGGVFQFYCVPNSPDQEITWYTPNGDVIPADAQSSSLYHIRDGDTGESVLYTNNGITSNTEGNNFTCSFTPSSGPAIESSFGIYYVGQDNDDVYGIRLYGPGNVIYEFVYQIGTFSVDLASKYDIECLNPSNQISQWEFEPNLVSENARTNTLITQAQFNPNATCQYISCNPSVQYPVFYDKPFFLQTNVTGGQPNCRPNDHLYEFSLGSPIELYITCPLIFGSRFLDISDIDVMHNDFTVDTSRRLFFNTTTLATLALEQNFVCEDTYGDSVSFSIRILANEAIQLLDSEDSDTPIANGTDLIGVAIPSIIYCITQSNENSANWLVDANPNRSLNEEPIPVNNDSDIFPYATNPRVGRSNLVLSGTIESGSEGFYTCVTNPRITVGIFSQNPVPPNATISPGQTVIQVVIGTNTPVLNCEHSNSPHPLPIYFWTGSISSSTATLDTNLFLESNSGEYTCTASNVVGLSTDTVTITVIPPPPQFNSIQSLQDTIYISDDVTLRCEFYTFENVTSQILIDWYKDGIIVSEANISPTRIENTITGFLNLLNSQIEVEGDYHCQASIGASQASVSPNLTLKVSPPPNPMHIRLVSISQEHYLGQDALLQCEFSTERRFQEMLKIDWYHNNTKLSNTSEIEITMMDTGHYMVESSLSLSNITFIQAGEYRCVGRIVDILSSEQTNSTPYTLNVRTPTTLSPSISEPIVTDQVSVIIGVLIGILFIIAAILIVVLIIIIACRMGYKNKADQEEGLPYEIMSRGKGKKNKPFITPTASIGINMDAAYGENPQYQDDEGDGRLTFRKSDAFQETLLTNLSAEGATAEPSSNNADFENYNIPLAIFPQKVLEYHLANNAEFDRQYCSLPEVWLHDVSIGSHINNRRKNRFTDIIPYEHSRVKLSLTGEHNSDYINACYIDGYYHRGAYIASQGPMPHTANDFWRMIWEKNIDHIVALTKVMEAGRRKCEQYWPENETDMCEFDMIQVTLKKCERYTTYDIRMMEVTHAEYPTDVRIVIQFHYTVWPDHGVPIFSSSLISFINHTKEYHIPKRAQPPMLVHCSAGVGRTGTFIVLDYFMEHLKENDEVNIYKCVAELRENRCLMVQTKEQYIFIHDALLDFVCCKDTFIADHEFQAYLDNAMVRNMESMSTPFEDQYELIMKTSRIVDERDIAEASDAANIMKNRFPNFVPFDSHRVTVIPDQDGDKDYINASFVHSYHKHKGFIAAQGPLEHTIYDFWKMITTLRVQFIIMLSDLSEGGHEMCAKYWPEEGQEMLVQYLVIICDKEEELDDYILRNFVVSTQQVALLIYISVLDFYNFYTYNLLQN